MAFKLAAAAVTEPQKDPSPVFSRRVGFAVRDGGLVLIGPSRNREHRNRPWPLGTITLYRDHLSLSGPNRTYKLGYTDIERIVPLHAFMVQIRHRSRFVPTTVLAWGWRLPHAVATARSRYALPFD